MWNSGSGWRDRIDLAQEGSKNKFSKHPVFAVAWQRLFLYVLRVEYGNNFDLDACAGAAAGD